MEDSDWIDTNVVMKKLYYEDRYLLFDRPVTHNVKYHIKGVFYVFISFGYKFLLNLIKPKNTAEKKQYKVAVCSIFRDEAAILKEWLEFHKIVGVEHFYLYNNFSIDNYKAVLEPYIADGTVTLIDWPYHQAQMSAYQNCVDLYRNETKWIGFIDLDEFVVPNMRYNTIYEFLKQFDTNRPVVIIYWRYFGCSGRIDRDRNHLVTEDFTLCWYKYANIGKLFYNTDYGYNPKEKHTLGYMHNRWGTYKKLNFPPVNVFDKICVLNCNKVSCSEMPIQINHYLLKSYNEYKECKARRGGGVHKKQDGFHDDEYFFRHDSLCQNIDVNIFKYMARLKLALGITDR